MAERVLITQLGFLGDLILSTPLIEVVHRHYPAAEIDFLTTKAGAPLVRHHPLIKEVIAYDKRKERRGIKGFFEQISELKKKGYARVFSLHRSARTTLLHYLSGIPERYGFREARFSALYSRTTPRLKGQHDVLRNLSLLKVIGVEGEVANLRVEIPQEIELAARNLVSSDRYLVIAPGSVWRTKRWTVEGFSAVAKALSEQGERVVLIGGGEDADTGRVIERRVPTALNLVGRTDLLTSAAIIKSASVVLANDSSPLHLASTFKRPTVALFCATVPEFGFGPWQTNSIVLGVEGLHCRPCGRHGKDFCPTGTHACQLGITVEQVLGAISQVQTA